MDLIDKVYKARERIKNVAIHTPLMKNENLNEEFSAQIYLKREDLQPVRSYKLTHIAVIFQRLLVNQQFAIRGIQI